MIVKIIFMDTHGILVYLPTSETDSNFKATLYNFEHQTIFLAFVPSHV